LLDKIKTVREESYKVAQGHSVAPTVLVTDEGEGPSYRMREALQLSGKEEKEEEDWVQKGSDPTPLQGNGGRIPPPPRGNGGDPEPSDHDLGSENHREDRKGKASKKPTPPEDNDAQLAKLVKIRSIELGGSNRKPADPPFLYKHLDYQDKVWLLTCQDYFTRNPTYWVKEEDRIIYTIGRMKGKEVAAFALSYRKQMTGGLGFQKQEGYEYWHIFTAEVILRFTVSHKAERALGRMDQVKY